MAPRGESPVTTHLVLGGPGCGKTTRLLSIVAEEMGRGVPPDRIAFVAFTRAAAHEARRRAAEQFSLDPERDLPWFRTIHSLVYAQLGLTKDELLGKRDWDEFSTLMGYQPGYSQTEDDLPTHIPGSEGDYFAKMMRLIDYSVTTMEPLEHVWHDLNEPVRWHDLKQCDAAFTQFKQDIAKVDFTDMLRQYALGEGQPLPVDVAIVDEAQDLTTVQWKVVRYAFRTAQRWYIGGDDDQAIYTWAGANVKEFLHLKADTVEVLPISYRLPQKIHSFAQRQIQSISDRYAKRFRSVSMEGDIEWHNTVAIPELNGGSWFFLARNNYLIRRLIASAREQGHPYQVGRAKGH
jgi:DNA helicase-2/ATP-dependent DNA helicase PcrA